MEKATVLVVDGPRLVGEILEGGLVEASCGNGHQVTYLLNEPAFELIFEMASLALLDGYYREAVLGFTTALERFFEFYVAEVCRRAGVDAKTYASASKTVHLAERQL